MTPHSSSQTCPLTGAPLRETGSPTASLVGRCALRAISTPRKSTRLGGDSEAVRTSKDIPNKGDLKMSQFLPRLKSVGFLATGGERGLSEEKKKLRLTVTLPTKESVVKALKVQFPGIEVEVEEVEAEEEKPPTEEKTEEAPEPT